MMFKSTWLPALALLTAALTGCTEGPSSHALAPATQPSPTANAAATSPCAAPVAAAAPSPATPVAASQPAPAVKAAADEPLPVKKASHLSEAQLSRSLKVKRLVLAEDVKGREPVEPATSFSVADMERIYAFVEVENGAGEEAEITVAFEPPDGGAAKGNVALTVGASPRWRTWAFTRGARTPGAWAAVVRAPNGEVLARTPFEVTL